MSQTTVHKKNGVNSNVETKNGFPIKSDQEKMKDCSLDISIYDKPKKSVKKDKSVESIEAKARKIKLED